jgi:hypothetical protein
VIEEPVAPVLQEYVVAPLALKVTVEFGQIVAEFTLTVGVVFTVTVATAVAVHAPFVPVTV